MSKHNTIGKGVSERAVNGGLDKFYTKQYIADYFSHIVLDKYGIEYQYVEPTAGNGAFLNVIPNIKGYDLVPEREDIQKANVFTQNYDRTNIIIGNPPFGMNASLAIDIFNHIASSKVKAICFIVPKTFKKQSTHNKLDLNYHLVDEYEVPKNAFIVNDVITKNVPCVFQIWEYKPKRRKEAVVSSSKYFEFTTPDKADIAVRRVGGKAGQLLEGIEHSSTSTYFLKIHNPLVVKAIKLIDLSFIDYTAGVRSISKQELIMEVDRIMGVLDDS